MKNLTAYLVGVLVAGCGAGVSSDPTEVAATPLETAPTPLLANVLTTQVLTSDATNDATYVAIVQDLATQTARLVRQDVRNAEVIELDHMPFGKGTAQFVSGSDGIVWGFGGDGSEPATFRLVASTGATDIPFADHGPASLMSVESHQLYYASTHDCAIEPIDLTTGQFNHGVTTSISCFMTIESVVQTQLAAILRTSDSPGYSIRGYGKSTIKLVLALDQADSAFTGPFPSTVEPVAGAADTQNPGWSRMDSDGKSHILTVATNPWSLQPNPGHELGIVDGAIDAGVVVHREFWGATRGDPAILSHVTSAGTKRYTVDYQPRAMFSLHGRLVVLADDGTLLDQPISADD